VTASESETSRVQSTASGAEEELWLTYLNYDQSVGQAVRRLGALSPENVDLFRGLLLKSRDRSKVKDYEAESIRRVQGEAFVGDEELQRTLIVLHAEDPRFGEELKRLVAATGRPEKLDQAVAAIRSGQPVPDKPAVTASPVKATLAAVKEPPREPTHEPAEKAVKTAVHEPAKQAVVVPLHNKERAAPVPVEDVRREEVRKPVEANTDKEKQNARPLLIAAAVVLLAVVGVVLMAPGLVGGRKASESRMATAPVAAQPSAAPVSPAPAAQHAPAPAVDLAMPAQAGASSSPPLRPASVQPEVPASDAPQPADRAPPVAGSKYRVMRGDMLSDIAFQVYHDASKFRLIQAANPGIRNKDRILADQVIFIPPDSR
jgi:nucleoid-associated protein YgaU